MEVDSEDVSSARSSLFWQDLDKALGSPKYTSLSRFVVKGWSRNLDMRNPPISLKTLRTMLPKSYDRGLVWWEHPFSHKSR